MPQLPATRVRCVVKLGGAAITHKQQREELNAAALTACAEHLNACYTAHPGSLIVVHGAGSFGHHVAREGGVAQGGLDRLSVLEAFAHTRLSVCKLHQLVLQALLAGVLALGVAGVAVCSCGF